MSNPQKAEFSLQYGIYFYMRNLTFHSIPKGLPLNSRLILFIHYKTVNRAYKLAYLRL